MTRSTVYRPMERILLTGVGTFAIVALLLHVVDITQRGWSDNSHLGFTKLGSSGIVCLLVDPEIDYGSGPD